MTLRTRARRGGGDEAVLKLEEKNVKKRFCEDNERAFERPGAAFYAFVSIYIKVVLHKRRVAAAKRRCARARL